MPAPVLHAPKRTLDDLRELCAEELDVIEWFRAPGA
jgi:hypothetical protein